MIADLKNSVNIVDVIGEVVKLTHTGRSYLGLCPFHKEKTPSFNVVEDKQFFHCFGCGKSGDVFKFLEEYRQISFMESLAVIAERAGIRLDIGEPTQSQKEDPNQILYDMHEEAAKFYHAILMTTKEGQQAKEYLYARGISEDVLTYFNIGLSPNQPDLLYQQLSRKYKDQESALSHSGLFNVDDNQNRFYDAFKNRIMFPLTDDKGRVIAFSGRIWTSEDIDNKVAKYKNTRSTVIFNKSYELYHMDRAKLLAPKKQELYLMEGFMDVIAAYQAGIENAVASMGTALTREHLAHLKRFTKKLVLTYDGDNAGQAAISKTLDIVDDMQVDIVKIPGQMDPDEFLRHHSKEALKKLLEQGRISAVEFYIDYLKPDNLDNLQAQIAYVEQMAKLIAKERSLTAQDSYIRKLADLLPDFNYDQLEQAVNNERLLLRQSRSQVQAKVEAFIPSPISPRTSALERSEIHLFHRLLHHDYLLQSYRNRLDFFFHTKELDVLYRLLCEEGDILPSDLAEVDEKTADIYYRVLAEQLPKEVTEGELEELEKRREIILRQADLQKQSKQIRESSSQGDVDGATLALDELIAQKRSME
ncbi:DNA primase [Streptococcus sp. zg-JUN1979]|uniref:DNA primase n=1 Tax=Streptococcus sp. zg-JUN1979 TaxID=3391450 RepID=UPI0039A57F9A